MATTVLGLKTFAASDPVDYNEVNDNYNKIDNGVKTALQGRAAHNLLDNSDFRNPVNQRGETSYTANGHTIDRWRDTSNATTIITENGLTLQNNSTSSNAYWRQRIPANALTNGKTYTMAININGDVFCGAATIDASNTVTFYGANGLYLSCTGLTSSSYWTIQIAASAGKSFSGVRWAALYEGSYDASTLPAYQPKGYAAELAECMRYYQVFGKKRIVQSTEPNGGFTISERFPIAMRVAPTITGTYVAWATLASGPAAVVEKTDRLSTSESRADGFMGYYVVGIATEMMILDYAFTASADL